MVAGVKEGAELERYIKLVGDAAIGSNRPMSEIAQIFNRIQGNGKLTRIELDMINHGLPGFSQAMAKHVGADTLDAFHDMVSAGQVGTDEFLNVMEKKSIFFLNSNSAPNAVTIFVLFTLKVFVSGPVQLK